VATIEPFGVVNQGMRSNEHSTFEKREMIKISSTLSYDEDMRSMVLHGKLLVLLTGTRHWVTTLASLRQSHRLIFIET
jgi:endo-1,4-beta-mannosidase